MKSIFDASPRPHILASNFNLRIFTVFFKQVIDRYLSDKTRIASIHTDLHGFFAQAPFPTYGLKRVLQRIFRRISCDHSSPAICRLETAFGGDKVHSPPSTIFPNA